MDAHQMFDPVSKSRKSAQAPSQLQRVLLLFPFSPTAGPEARSIVLRVQKCALETRNAIHFVKSTNKSR